MNYFHPLKVLITSPSTNSEFNIGGISTFTKNLIENNYEIQYVHFVRGKRIKDKRNIIWLKNQIKIIFNYIFILLSHKNIRIVHINMAFEKYAIFRDTLFVIISYCFQKKIIIHFHGGYYNFKKNVPILLKWLVDLSIHLSNNIITLGAAEKKFLNEFYKVELPKIHVINNGIKLYTETLILKNYKEPSILFIGRIDKNKGLKEILLALELLKKKMNYKFLIAGDGYDKEVFLKNCEEKIPDNFEYKGIVSGDKKESLFQNSDIFLMPSYYEGLPFALIEAMANKLIPIVTSVGSIPEIVEDRENGFLIPPYDYRSIYVSILEINENPVRSKEISDNAYNTIKKKFSLNDQIYAINNIYKSLS